MPFDSLMKDLNVMVNSIAFTSKDKSKLADIFRSCRSEADIRDFYSKVRPIYLKRLGAY